MSDGKCAGDTPSNSGSAPKPDQTDKSKTAPDASATPTPNRAKDLTPDEQMALYEEDLKESDWGHQPC